MRNGRGLGSLNASIVAVKNVIAVVTGAWVLLALSACASGPQAKDLAPNVCASTENSTADFADIVDDSGETIVSLHFRCTYQKTDAKRPESLDPNNHMNELKKAGRNLKKIEQVERRYEQSQEKYLKDKCPKDWTGEVVWEPFGWKCYSEEIPLTKACPKGKPLKIAGKSEKKDLVCVTNPKFYPK